MTPGRGIRIACIGWGSLIWRPGTLPLAATSQPWNTDGPELPIEYARQSQNFPITLVITPGAKVVRALWAALDVESAAEARRKLSARESKGGIPEIVCGLWVRGAPPADEPGAERIATWAQPRDLDAVVWTKLSPLFSGDKRVPSRDEVIDYIASLTREQQQRAFEYVRKTPRQVATAYRAAIEYKFGFSYDTSTDQFIAAVPTP